MTQEKEQKYNDILSLSSIENEKNKLTREELVELKSYAIKKKLKLQTYVRN